MRRCIEGCKEGIDQSLIDILKSDLDAISARLCQLNRGALGSALFDELTTGKLCCLFLQDRSHRYIWLSDERPFGLDGLLTLGKTDGDLFSPAEAERQKEVKQRVMQTGEPVRTQIHLSAGGIERHLDCIYYPWKDENGIVLGVGGCLRDVAERRMAEIRMQKMTRAVENSRTATVLSDSEGIIEYVNPWLMHSCGYSDPSQMIGRSVFDFTNEDGKIKLQEEIIPALLSQGEWQGELPIVGNGGRSYTAEMICTMISEDSQDSVSFLANFYNISDRMRAEEALLLDESRLEALLKLNQMDEATLKELADYALQAGVKLTGSRIG